MVRPESRSNVWFYALIVIGALVAVSLIGAWNTLDLQCPGNSKTFVVTHFPPEFQCKTVY